MLVQANLSEGLPLQSGSVHTVICSPPYMGLRNYAIPPSIWGGQPDCPHDWQHYIKRGVSGGTTSPKLQTHGLDNFQIVPDSDNAFCTRCGAWQGQLGQEPTLGQFIAHLVEIFEAVKRVLRDDGILWVVMGDAFAGSGGPGGDPRKYHRSQPQYDNTNRAVELPNLNKLLAPHRFAIAMQEAGWICRQDIPWAKGASLCKAWSGAVMPESVSSWRWEHHKVKASNQGREKQRQGANPGRPQSDHNGQEFAQDAVWTDCPGCPQCKPHDGLVLRKGAWRPTNTHEYIFMFTKTDEYYTDLEAVREKLACPEVKNMKFGGNKRAGGKTYSGNTYDAEALSGRNLRSVWAPSRAGYRGDHYAAYPATLVEPMIKAATSGQGVCTYCESQWARVKGTQDFLPTCDCPPHTPVPAIVLDIFGGSGTTGMVAQALGRRWICTDLGWDYLQQAKERTGMKAIEEWLNGVEDQSSMDDLPMFAGVSGAGNEP